MRPDPSVIDAIDPEMLFADGFDEALIGWAQRCGQPALAVYDAQQCVDILARDMPYDEAVEYFVFNIVGAWVGPNTPLFVNRWSDE